MIQDHDIAAWLGPIADETTDEQREAIRDAWETLGEMIDPDDWQREACDAAGQYVLGDVTVASAADDLMRARARAEEAAAVLRGVVVAAAQSGESEASLAASTGLSRTTVRAWLGK